MKIMETANPKDQLALWKQIKKLYSLTRHCLRGLFNAFSGSYLGTTVGKN